jgi:pyruvate formate lyase activating enzyme
MNREAANNAISRRKFLVCGSSLLPAAVGGLGLWPFSNRVAAAGGRDIRGRVFKGDAPRERWKWSIEGFYYKKLKNNHVACGVCPNRCVLAPGDRSICRSKVNFNGKLYSLVYGNPCAVNIDPIEKKPLFHFMPQSKAFSIATTGCNFRCLNCQNWEISQAKPQEVRHYELFPPEVVARALETNSASIAYTYSEAITFYEYMLDTARLASEKGINNLLISNGFINPKPLLNLCQVLDGANINLKSLDDDTYRRLNGGRLQPVLETLKTLHREGVHFELTTLVVPGYADSEAMLKEICHWILDNLGPNYPFHLLRFFPKYKLDRLPPTPVKILTRFREMALDEGIRYVYVGNVPGHEGNHTYCHNCKRLLIERRGYYITIHDFDAGHCKFCHTRIPGAWTHSKGGV